MNSKEKEQFLKLAEYYFKNKNYSSSQKILEQILQVDLNNSKANELLSYIYGNLGESNLSFQLLVKACQQKDCSPEALYYLGSIQLKNNLFDQAILSFKKSISIGGDFFEANHDLATAYAHKGDYTSAIFHYKKCLKYERYSFELFYNIAKIFDNLKDYESSVAYYVSALNLEPSCAEAWFGNGFALANINRHEEAVTHYRRALNLKPNYFECLASCGYSLIQLNRYDEAVEYYDKSLKLRTDYAEGWANQGVISAKLNHHKFAIDNYDKALKLKPDFAEAWANKAVTLVKLKDYKNAIDHYDQALKLKPDYVEALINKGNLLIELKSYEDAINLYEKALSINPNADWVYGNLLLAKMKVCLWRNLSSELNVLKDKIFLNKKVITPFTCLSLIDSNSLHAKVAQIFVESKFPQSNFFGPFISGEKNKKIRLGYFSANFYDHALGGLVAELFELHDKNQFELIGFSFGPQVNDLMSQRLKKSFDFFVEVGEMSDIELVKLSREFRVDIAIDLTGFTQDTRMGIFAYRVAPIQVSYLGYPGTLGSEYIDYIIADKNLIPINSQEFYCEKIIYLPDTYQANDRKRIITQKAYTKKDFGLPDDKFIFCCFNNVHKILPKTFNGWMRILRSFDNSILWLLYDNPVAVKNLRKEAERQGVCGDRIFFAERINLQEHLARHRFADLFLDTFPYNAHTTASDALWAGLPVLTLMGQSFASRVAASLLKAIDLPELITNSQEEYETLAIELAMNPKKLANIKSKLEINRSNTPLFDTPLFTKNIEAAYTNIFERYQAGLEPTHISII